MRILNKIKFIKLLPIILVSLFFISASKIYAITPRVDLLTADDFAVLGGSAITGTNTNTVTGNVGLSPTGGTAITELTCSEVTGTIYDTNGGYGGGVTCLITDAGLLTTAKNDLTTAFNDASGRTITSRIATELGGSTLTDGVYDSAAGTFGITGTLTLDGQGNADSVFIFKMATTLTTASSSKIVLVNSAQACNVYWLVGSSATLGTSSTLIGNVMASESITDDGFSTVDGRLLAKNGAVTLNNTIVTKKTCAAGTAGAPTSTPTSTPTPTPTSTSTSTSTSGTAIVYCPPIIDTVVSPIIIESKRINTDSIFIKWGPYSGTDKFNIEYGFESGKFLYNTNVTGFSTTINNLKTNQPIWVRVAARNDCQIGTYGEPKFVGSPKLPNTGFAPQKNSLFIFLNQIKNWFL